MDYDFSGLTPAQQRVLTFKGWHIEDADRFPQPSRKTVKKLLDRGLVIEHVSHESIFTFREYEVSTPVHVAWCEHCSRQR